MRSAMPPAFSAQLFVRAARLFRCRCSAASRSAAQTSSHRSCSEAGLPLSSPFSALFRNGAMAYLSAAARHSSALAMS